MSANSIQKYGPVALLDVLSSIGIPTATASQIYQDYLNKKVAEGVEILLSEIRQGDFSGIDKSEMISIIARYQRDAMEGVARNNLRLLARVISGMAKKNELHAPSFLKYANILSGLTEEEIVVLGTMVEVRKIDPHINPNILRGHLSRKGIINYEHIQQALMRTGLIIFDVDAKSTTNINPYPLSPLVDEILQYAEFLIKKDAE